MVEHDTENIFRQQNPVLHFTNTLDKLFCSKVAPFIGPEFALDFNMLVAYEWDRISEIFVPLSSVHLLMSGSGIEHNKDGVPGV